VDAVLDVVVDVRPGTPTYGQWEAFENFLAKRSGFRRSR
jgi:dTDP-4-dehydrorhamnose 3,5-epimerase-like enzyme